jgi:hypothetical protein
MVGTEIEMKLVVQVATHEEQAQQQYVITQTLQQLSMSQPHFGQVWG